MSLTNILRYYYFLTLSKVFMSQFIMNELTNNICFNSIFLICTNLLVTPSRHPIPVCLVYYNLSSGFGIFTEKDSSYKHYLSHIHHKIVGKYGWELQ